MSGYELPGQLPGLAFVVPGDPVAKGRPRFSTRGGFAHTFTPERTATFERRVRDIAGITARASGLRAPIAGAVRLFVRAFFPRLSRAAASRPEAVLKTTRPDGDNILKGVADALNPTKRASGILLDDAQVSVMVIEKWHSAEGEDARTEVRIDPITPELLAARPVCLACGR